MCITACPFKWAIFRSPIPPKQPLLWRGFLRGVWLLPTKHLFICKINKCNGTCTEVFTQRPECKMPSGWKGMYKPHCHRTAFMNDLGDGLKGKVWYILKRMRAKYWELAFFMFSFVKRWMTIIHRRESSLFVVILAIQVFESQGIIKKYQYL